MANDKIQLELNKPYTQTALAEVLGISDITLIRNKERWLTNLALYYKFNAQAIGHSIVYVFTEQLGEYQRPRTYKKRRNKI